jgi:hypothetical protein
MILSPLFLPIISSKDLSVQVPFAAPYLCNKIDAHLEKLVFTSFFCVLRVKISGVKPWMLFRKKKDLNPQQLNIVKQSGRL